MNHSGDDISFVFPPAPLPVALPVMGSDALFPVRRVYCVGQNYSDHVAEMGGDSREPPFFFSKPADALVPGGGGDVAYPPKPKITIMRWNWFVAIATGDSGIFRWVGARSRFRLCHRL